MEPANGVVVDGAAGPGAQDDPVLGDGGGRADTGDCVVVDVGRQAGPAGVDAIFLDVEEGVAGEVDGMLPGVVAGDDAVAVLDAVERVVADVFDRQVAGRAAGIIVSQAGEAVVAVALLVSVDREVGDVSGRGVQEPDDRAVGDPAPDEAVRQRGGRLDDGAAGPGADNAQVLVGDRHLAEEGSGLDVDRVPGCRRVHAPLDGVGCRRFALLRDEDIAALQADEADARGVEHVGNLVLDGVERREVGWRRHGGNPAHEAVEGHLGRIDRVANLGAVTEHDVLGVAAQAGRRRPREGQRRARTGHQDADRTAAHRRAAGDRQREVADVLRIVHSNAGHGRVGDRYAADNRVTVVAGPELRVVARCVDAVLVTAQRPAADRDVGRRRHVPQQDAVDVAGVVVVRHRGAHAALDRCQLDAEVRRRGRKVAVGLHHDRVIRNRDRAGVLVLQVVEDAAVVSRDRVVVHQRAGARRSQVIIVVLPADVDPRLHVVAEGAVDVVLEGRPPAPAAARRAEVVARGNVVDLVVADVVARRSRRAGRAVDQDAVALQVLDDVMIGDQRHVVAAGVGVERIDAVVDAGAGIDHDAVEHQAAAEVGVVAVDGEAVDGDVDVAAAAADAEDRAGGGPLGRGLGHPRFDNGLGAAHAHASDAGVGPQQRHRLVDQHVLGVSAGLDVDGVIGRRRIDAILDVPAGGRDVNVARLEPHEADAAGPQKAAVQRIGNLVLDAVQLPQRGRGPAQTVE